jgi:hypothetical protein
MLEYFYRLQEQGRTTRGVEADRTDVPHDLITYQTPASSF